MTQKSMQAYFHSFTEAQSTVNKLKALRVLDVQIDRVDSPGSISGAEATTSTIAVADEQASGLGLVGRFDSGHMDYSRGEGQDMPDTLLKVVMDESTYEQALRVIREGGGVI